MSFEKDPEYGGLIIDTNLTTEMIKNAQISHFMVSLLCYGGIFIFILFFLKHLYSRDYKKKM